MALQAYMSHEVGFFDAYFDDEYIFASNRKLNAFMVIKRDNFEVVYMCMLDKLRNNKSGDIFSIYRKNNKLYLCFSYSFEVVSYNMETKSVEYFYPQECSHLLRFPCTPCRIKDEIWLFQRNFDKGNELIGVFSLENATYKIYHGDFSKLCRYNQSNAWVAEKPVVVGSEVWRCISGTDVIFSFDTEKKEITIFETGSNVSFFFIEYNEGFFYLTTLDGKNVVCWNKEKGVVANWSTNYNGEVQKPYRQAICVNNRLIVMPAWEKHILCYDIEGGVVKQKHNILLSEESLNLSKNMSYAPFAGYKLEKEYIYIYPNTANNMVILNTNTLKVSYQPFYIKPRFYIEYMMQLKKRRYLLENDMTLEKYIQAIQNDLSISNSAFTKDISKQIYSFCKP